MSDILIRGGASSEEVAAVLAVVAGRGRPTQRDPKAGDPLARWRRLRQAVTKPT